MRSQSQSIDNVPVSLTSITFDPAMKGGQKPEIIRFEDTGVDEKDEKESTEQQVNDVS